MRVSVIFPTKDEEENIEDLIKKCKKVLKNFEYEIIVIDDSKDRTPEIAKSLGAKVIRNIKGYGNAYINGFKIAKGDYIVMLDADGSYDPSEIPKLLEPLIKNMADFVIGSRFKGKIMPKAMPWHHRYIGNPLLTKLMNILFKTKITDAHSGMRAIKREALLKLNLKCPGMEFASEMILEAVRKGLKIMEVPITYYPRKGRSKLRSFRDGWRHLRFMLLYSPTALFVIPGTILLAAGTVLVLYVLFLDPIRTHTLILGSLLTVLGLQTFFFGVSSKIYSVEIGLAKDDRITRFFSRYTVLEEGIVVGLILVISGLCIGYYVFKVWYESGFGKLNQLNMSILSFLLIIVGIQIIFNSFFISSLKLRTSYE